MYKYTNNKIKQHPPAQRASERAPEAPRPRCEALRLVRGLRATERTENAGPWQRRSRNASKALRFRAFAFARFMCEKFLRFEVSHFAATFVDMWRHIFIDVAICSTDFVVVFICVL